MLTMVRFELVEAALRLHGHLVRRHIRDGILMGPDPGIKFNLRLWRFVKSYLRLQYGPERHVFLQGQSYWILSNWTLYDLVRDGKFLNWARLGADKILSLQSEDGSWQYPLRERRHLRATVEGNWACLALLESFRRTNQEDYLQGALQWKKFLIDKIGFQWYEGTLSVNYFDKPRGNIPNNVTNAIWVLAEFAALEPGCNSEEIISGMKAFLKKVQRPDGEFPYILASPYEKAKLHYLCYQYNAFEFLDLCHYYEMHKEQDIALMLEPLAKFLEKGVDTLGRARASCMSAHPFVVYYTAAAAMALWKANRLGVITDPEKSNRGFRYLLETQRADGSFPHSFQDYRVLMDTRSYPRYQAMILYFLSAIANELKENS